MFPTTRKHISASNKKLIFGEETQKLFPLKYHFLMEAYLNQQRNFWTPEEIGMGKDLAQYVALPEAERQLYDWTFSMLTTMDQYAMINSMVNVATCSSTPEFDMWLARQAYDESLHTHAYDYIAEAVMHSETREATYDRYLDHDALYNKLSFMEEFSDSLITARENKDVYAFFRGYAGWVLILEGLWFRMGLAGPVQALARRGLMMATAEQFQYIFRDETAHFRVGLQVLQTLDREYGLLDPHMKAGLVDSFTRAIALEEDFIHAACKPMLGFNPDDYILACQSVVNDYCAQLGIDAPFPEARTMAWMDEMISTRKEKNFFETRVQEYQVGNALDGTW